MSIKRRRLLIPLLYITLDLLWMTRAFAEGSMRPESVYISMQDGVQIALDLYLPKKHSINKAKVSTIVQLTRYWRSMQSPPEMSKPDYISYFNNAGYAVAVVDTRGSGASFGFRDAELSLNEGLDTPQVLDWIADQSWSDGNVVTYGSSYTGNTALVSAIFPSRYLKAVVSKFPDFDHYLHLSFPGGIKNAAYFNGWGQSVYQLDRNIGLKDHRIHGVKAVDIDFDGDLLERAIRGHEKNLNSVSGSKNWLFRDDAFYSGSYEKPTHQPGKRLNISHFLKNIEKSQLPLFLRASWFDAGTAAGAIAAFRTLDVPRKIVIGPWTHGGGYWVDPYDIKNHGKPALRKELLNQELEFISKYLKGENTSREKSILEYYVVGANKWKTTTIWPPMGIKRQTLYFESNSTLSENAPNNKIGKDSYIVDFSVGSGSGNRWLQGTIPDFSNRADTDKKLLTYTSPPLSRDTEITGHPVVTLYVNSTHDDGAFIVYFEDVSPNGTVTMLTEGELRAIHRNTSSKGSPYITTGPFRTFYSEDASPLIPGNPAKLEFELLPISVLIKKGHSLRVAIAGHDRDVFARVPEKGSPQITIHRDRDRTSSIELPILGDLSWK